MNIIEAIKERRSVRSFNGESLTQSQISELENAVKSAESPFGGNVTIRLKSFDMKDGFKPSTYGMIIGAVDFFLLGIKDDKQSALTAGFKFVLDCGIGICHFYETEKFNQKSGTFDELANAPAAPDNWIYLVSYIETK